MSTDKETAKHGVSVGCLVKICVSKGKLMAKKSDSQRSSSGSHEASFSCVCVENTNAQPGVCEFLPADPANPQSTVSENLCGEHVQLLVISL